MKTRIGLLTLVLLLALTSVAFASSGNGVDPIVVGSWQAGDAASECSLASESTGITYEYGYKIDEWVAGVPNDGDYVASFPGGHTNTITIANDDGYYFDWAATSGIGAVIVKAGAGANIFKYDPQAMSDTGLYGFNTVPGDPRLKKEISHVTFCWNADMDFEELTVSKTAETSYIRTHDWSIAKSVETENGYTHDGSPKVWLYIDGSGDETATWTVDVTYEGYEDSGRNVSGDITIENTGTLDAVITNVEDVLAGAAIDVDCGVTPFPYTLPVGETLTCTYDEAVESKIEGFNVATVTTERDEYSGDAEIIWGDPTTEINATVNVKDISDLFGEVALGTVTAPNGAQFTYTKDFAWADYGQDSCGDYGYDNTATIVETGQSASALLLVNVQCYVYETAYAKGGSATCFIPTFSRWGWTNPIMPREYTWDLWAGAAQCDTSKGALVGSVTVVYGADGYVTVTYNVNSPYILDETHVYAGYAMFPLDGRGRPTVAPGAYTNASPFDGSQIYVIAHAVVGIPDPDFGP